MSKLIRSCILATVLALVCAVLTTALPASAATTLPAPTNFRVTSVATDRATLAWDPAATTVLVGYDVRLNAQHQSHNTGSRTSQTFTDLRAGTTYTATLSVLNTTGPKAPDIQLTFTTVSIPGPAPAAPANLRPVYSGNVLHSIAWDPSTHTQPVAYKVYTSVTVYNSITGLLDYTMTPSLRIWDLVFSTCIVDPGSTHTITVVAYDANGRHSADSAPLTVAIPVDPIP
ncbi:fibronectin type III domain-containing protein [Kribbella catacumbae]|uniref:fibronectin type III domain-containing protein n=1 Tax=Kribbella catacumbae TaxID=460086 RepID=UPI000382695E|nr:fibronectin type III domain-containing protein [Kribbella catacumbae]